MNNDTIVFENTYYSLFLYILYDSNWLKSDYLIFGNRVSSDFVKRLNKHVNCIDEHTQYLGNSGPIPNFLHNPLKFYSEKIKQKKLFNRYNTIIGNTEDIDNSLVHSKRIQIEDGIGTRQRLKDGPKKKGIIHYLRKSLCLREANTINYVENVIVAQPVEALESLKHKLIIIDIKECWKKKSDTERKLILSLFNINKNELDLINEKYNLLLTQPLNEDNNASEKDKINGYLQLIKEYNFDEKSLIIKPHPREKTDYKKHFPNATVIDKDFPSEIMVLLNIKVNNVITLFSTAASLFNENSNNIIYARAPSYFNFKEKYVKRVNNFPL